MDDVGNGRRGRRASASAELRWLLASAYGVDGDDARDLGGSVNLNLLITRAAAPCVVRVYRPFVTEARLSDVQRVRRHIDETGVPAFGLIPTCDGRPWARLGDRLVEVERFVEHDGGMNTLERLRVGIAVLGRVHSVMRTVDVSPEGSRVAFANHIEADRVRSGVAAGTERIRSWNPTQTEKRLADDTDRLADLVASGEGLLAATLPRQLVHGDFWDNNVFFAGGELVYVADFDFMAQRSRIDDLALTLYFTDAMLGLNDTASRVAALVLLVDAYNTGLEEPLGDQEREALPWAIARQPLWGMGGWVPSLDDEDAAKHHANDTAGDVRRALKIVEDIDAWVTGFA